MKRERQNQNKTLVTGGKNAKLKYSSTIKLNWKPTFTQIIYTIKR
jgi:hypothetical protein